MSRPCGAEMKKGSATMRKLRREVKIGTLAIGGDNPIAVQSMLNVPIRG